MIGTMIARLPGTLQAALWMLVIGTLGTVILVFSRRVSPGIHVFEIVFFRSLFGLLFMTPWLARHGK